MEYFCHTRALKNAKHLRGSAPHVVPREEPIEGYTSVIPREVLSHLHEARPPDDLARRLGRVAFPRLRSPPAESLFNGTLVFANLVFNTSSGSVSVSRQDLATAMAYARMAVSPISRYATQYGPNAVSVSPSAVPFAANVPGGRYNDQTLQGWVNAIAAQGAIPPSPCIVILNPPGVVNTDADPGQGVGGYHSMADVPYCFVNATGNGFTVPDQTNIYALALSHEIAEMVVDPLADLGNPEVCDPCVPAHEVLLGDNKPISDYEVGNRVVGAGGLQFVTKTFVRHYEGDLVEVKALGMLPFRVTPNHPLLVMRGRSRGATVTYHARDWQAAGGIKPKVRFQDGDYLVMPRLRGTVDCSEVSLIPYIQAHRATLKQTGQGARPYAYPHAESFPITTETAWMLGLYVAEGSPNPAHRSVAFDLHADQTALIERLHNVAKHLGHDLYVEPVRGERAVTACLASVILRRFLPDVCGKGAAAKRIPDFILYHSDEEILRAFVDGYMAGDGSTEFTQTGYEVSSFSTVSKTLALQLQLALGRLGIFISLRRKRPAQVGVILGRQVQLKETYRGLWCSDRRATRRKRLHRLGGGKAFFLPVTSVARIPFSGPVHNLETTDHTYLVSNAVTHNCGPNCQRVWIDYFDAGGAYLRAAQAFPPPFAYGFYINAIVQPGAANQCPAPAASCSYAPP